MRFFMQDRLKVLGASIIIILLLLPGISVAEQAFKAVYKKMVVNETVETNESQDLGDTITDEAVSTIEEGLNHAIKTESKYKVQEQELYGNKLAYIDANTQELVSYNLKSKERISITNNANFKEQLAMFKNRLVWTELNEVCSYEFKNNSIIKISDKSGDFPDIYGDLVVYRGLEEPGIYLYNFENQQTLTITKKTNGVFYPPSIWKDKITWVDDSDGFLNVYYYDLKQNTTTKITNFTEERYLGNPIATKKSIVYPLVDEAGVRQLMKYDLKNGETITIPGLKKGKFSVTVDKFDGSKINYYRTYDEIVTIDLDTMGVKEYPPMDNKVMYGGVIIGNEKSTHSKFKVLRNQ